MVELSIKTEVAELYPIKLELYGIVEDTPIYSNKYIEDKVIEWLHKSDITKPVSDKLQRLIRDNTIIIGHTEPGIFNFFYKKFKNWINRTVLDKDASIVLGYYSPINRRIVILLDDNVNIFGSSIRNIPPKLIHELIHLIADTDIKKFLSSTLQSTLIPYYTSLVKNISNNEIVVSRTDMNKALIELSLDSEGVFVNNSNINTSANQWIRLLNKYTSKDKSISYVKDMSLPYLGNITQTLNSKYMKDVHKSTICYHNAYKDIGVKSIGITIPGQEFKFPSEVVSITNEFELKPKIIQLINNFKY